MKLRYLILALLCASLPQLYKLTFPFQELFSGFISDDAFYYYKTAINLRNGLGSTFDTYNVTNGYHPLWMGFCVLAAYITTASSSYVYVILGINLVLALAVSVYVFAMFRQTLGDRYSTLLACCIQWNFTCGVALFSGLETPLYVLLLLISIDFVAKCDAGTIRDWGILGLLLGVTFLARTDFALVAPLLALYMVIRIQRDGHRHRLFRSVTFSIIVFLIVVTPYLMLNYVLVGHLGQVSGLIKLTWAQAQTFDIAQLYKFAASILSSLFVRTRTVPLEVYLPALALLCTVLCFRSPRAVMSSLYQVARDTRLWLMAAISIIFLLFYVYLVKQGHLQPWYLAFVYIAANVFLAHLLRILVVAQPEKQVRRLCWVAISLVVALNFSEVEFMRRQFASHHYHYGAPVPYRHKAAIWIRENLPSDAKIGVWDAGYVGYFSERAVINLDGLINGASLFDYLKKPGGVWDYISETDMDYISNGYVGEPEPVRSPLANRLELVHRIGPAQTSYDEHATYVDWYVWRVKKR